jgi:FKBP-type peptidyl-prolyl cis-trans isomerase FkpA
MARALRTSLLALAALLWTGCLDDSPFVPKIEETNFDPSLGVDLAASTRTSSGLYYRDILVGAGEQVAAEGEVPVQTTYTLHLRTGQHIESGDYDLTVGTGAGIDGYEEGIRGMRVGGSRQLIIPPHLGYGDQPNGPIPANSILVFTVTLVAID